MIFILITKQETDASKNTHFYNMSVTCYFIMIHQVIVMCLYEEEGGIFSCLLGCFAQTNESSNPVTMTNDFWSFEKQLYTNSDIKLKCISLH